MPWLLIIARFRLDPRDRRGDDNYFELIGDDDGIFGCMSLLACHDVCPKNLVKGYFVLARLVPEDALGTTFVAWPKVTVPVFMAMMFGATLGGNGTLIGASANIVCAGIGAKQGNPISFAVFMRYGMPVMLCQLAVSELYVVGLYYVTGR